MGGSGEDAAKHYPQVSHGTVPGSHYGSEDRARARDVEKLDHEDFPAGQYHVVDAVAMCHCWRGPVVGAENVFDKSSVGKKAHNQCYQTENKRYHVFVVICLCFTCFRVGSMLF